MSKLNAMLMWLPALLLTAALQAGSVQEVDPAIQTLVERFFAAQQAEDADAYLALWSTSARKPPREQLEYIFSSGDDHFTDVGVVRATIDGETARVRVTATRTRTDARMKAPDGSPRVFRTRLQLALSLVREAGAWRIVREGSPADELAAMLIEESDPAVRQSLMKAEPELLNARLVEALARRADSLVQREQYKAAQEFYERSLEVAQVIGDKKAEGQAFQNVATTLYFQRDFAGALAAYQRRLEVERAAANDEGIANARVGIGTILYSTYDYGAALTEYREALAIQERLNDEPSIATTLISTGNVLYLQGDYEAAIVDYRRAEGLKRKHFDLTGAASALEGLGRVYSAQGDYAAALGAFAGVLDERRARNDGPRQALVLQSIGEIHFRLGNSDAARAAFLQSRQLFEKFKDPGNAGRVLQGTAITELVVGRFPAAEKAYAESIAACTTAGEAECVARAQVGLAYALAAQEKFDEAVTWYGRSLISFNDLRMEEAGARARIGLAEALSGRGDHDKALEQAITARRTAIALDADDVLWRALVSVARAERRLERPLEALGSARAAVLAVERMAAAALERPGRAAPRDSAAAYAALAVLQAEQGDGEGAFQSAERMRAHALRAVLAPSERDIARGMSDEERAEERALSSALTTLIVQRESERTLPKPDPARLETLAAAIGEAGAKRTASQQMLFARLPELRTWRGLAGPASLEDVATWLDAEGGLLLAFVVDDHDVVILTAARTAGAEGLAIAAHAVPIKRQALAELVARATDVAALATVEAWRAASRDLFALLPRTVTEQLTAAPRIVVVPDDMLWRVPFEALPILDRYLADRASVTYAASAASAATAPSGAGATSAGGTVVAVTAPLVPPSVVESLKSTAPTWALRTADSSSAEVERVTAAPDSPPVILRDAAATKEAVTRAAASAAVLHIAAPFRVNSASPLFSPILLAAVKRDGHAPADVKKEGEDGSGAKKEVRTAPARDTELEAREVFNLSSAARLVVISDPSALSMRNATAGIGPIHWAWRASGATTVIMRRWRENDARSNEIVEEFYKQLAAGRPPTVALDAAQARARTVEGGRAPGAWAGWLVLDGR